MFTSQSETTGQSGFGASNFAAGSENVIRVEINVGSMMATLASPWRLGMTDRGLLVHVETAVEHTAPRCVHLHEVVGGLIHLPAASGVSESARNDCKPYEANWRSRLEYGSEAAPVPFPQVTTGLLNFMLR